MPAPGPLSGAPEVFQQAQILGADAVSICFLALGGGTAELALGLVGQSHCMDGRLCMQPTKCDTGGRAVGRGQSRVRGGLLVLVLHQVVRWRAVLGCPFVSVVDDEEEEEEDCFYIAPFFALEQTHCAHI